MISLVQLSLVPEFRRGHGALYDALTAGQVDEEALSALLTETLPPLVDGPEALAWSASDTIDDCLLEHALSYTEARRSERRRGGDGAVHVETIPYTSDAESSPERSHINTMPAAATALAKPSPTKYQFTATLKHLHTT